MRYTATERTAHDQHLFNQILDRLSDKHLPSLNALEIDVDGSKVTMRGRVYSFHERQIAISIPANMPSVVAIRDLIQVVSELTHAEV